MNEQRVGAVPTRSWNAARCALFLLAFLRPRGRRGDGALDARLGGGLRLRTLLDVPLDIALELADVAIVGTRAYEGSNRVGGGLDGDPSGHDVGKHGEGQRERATKPGLLLHLSELHGGHAGVHGGGSRLELIGRCNGAKDAV